MREPGSPQRRAVVQTRPARRSSTSPDEPATHWPKGASVARKMVLDYYVSLAKMPTNAQLSLHVTTVEPLRVAISHQLLCGVPAPGACM